jgi:hypothetical protein
MLTMCVSVSQGVGCYMFTIDSMNVIDATQQGNRARFINHHCQVNSSNNAYIDQYYY